MNTVVVPNPLSPLFLSPESKTPISKGAEQIETAAQGNQTELGRSRHKSKKMISISKRTVALAA